MAPSSTERRRRRARPGADRTAAPISERAREIKQRIADGTYQIDLTKLADALLDSELGDRPPVTQPAASKPKKKKR